MILAIYANSAQAPGLREKILSNTMSGKYVLASSQADTLKQAKSKDACFYQAMVVLSQFDDLGDLNTLAKARQFVEKCPSEDGFWESLRLFQLGYVEAEEGSSISAALTTRKAANGFLQHGSLEARAFYSIYAYYMEGTKAWIPFREDQRPTLLKTLDSARLASPRFWPLYSTSLVWILFDQHEYQKALSIVEWALSKHPSHPVFQQMRGDMLYRLKKFQEASRVYEKSLMEYSERAPRSIRWWSAAGNLLRIYAALGDTSKVRHYQNLFRDSSFELVRKRMPPSLMDALKEEDLLP